jgi:hypothetical protein
MEKVKDFFHGFGDPGPEPEQEAPVEVTVDSPVDGGGKIFPAGAELDRFQLISGHRRAQNYVRRLSDYPFVRAPEIIGFFFFPDVNSAGDFD